MNFVQMRDLIDRLVTHTQDSVTYGSLEYVAEWCVIRFRTPGPKGFVVISVYINADFTFYIGQSVCVTTPEALDILAAYSRASIFLQFLMNDLTPRNPLCPSSTLPNR
jgi:hypothetical protein